MAASLAVAAAGIFLAYQFYQTKRFAPEVVAAKFPKLYQLLANKYYVDELYDAVIVWPVVRMSREFLWNFVDTFMIDGAVNGVGRIVRGSASGLRRMQTGYVRTYAGWILLGGVLIIVWFLK